MTEYQGFLTPGDKAQFLNKNGYDSERTRAASILNTKTIYTVRSVDIGNWSSTYVFEEVPGCWNTVMFRRA